MDKDILMNEVNEKMNELKEIIPNTYPELATRFKSLVKIFERVQKEYKETGEISEETFAPAIMSIQFFMSLLDSINYARSMEAESQKAEIEQRVNDSKVVSFNDLQEIRRLKEANRIN